MPGHISLEPMGHWARVTLANPGKLNAIDIAMWHELRAVFERLQALPPADAPHAVIVCGVGGVHEVVPHDKPARLVQRRAEGLAELSPQPARINKQTLRRTAAGGLAAAERRAHFASADSADHREGVTAFIEKRPPRFQ